MSGQRQGQEKRQEQLDIPFPDTRLRVTESSAEKVYSWLRAGRGVAVWDSVNLGNPGAQWFTPARSEAGEAMGKPTWQAGNTPSRVVESMSNVVVQCAQVVKRFHVAVRASGNGLMTKVTDGGSRRIRDAVAKAAGDDGEAWYTFAYGDYDNVLIWKRTEEVPLERWAGVPRGW